ESARRNPSAAKVDRFLPLSRHRSALLGGDTKSHSNDVRERKNDFETSQSDAFAASGFRLASNIFGLTAESGVVTRHLQYAVRSSLTRASRCCDGLSGKIKNTTERVGQLARAIRLGKGDTCCGTAAPFPRDDDCGQPKANDVGEQENITCGRKKQQNG